MAGRASFLYQGRALTISKMLLSPPMAIVWIKEMRVRNPTAPKPPMMPMNDAIIKMIVFSFK
jgi:hypothetical protein